MSEAGGLRVLKAASRRAVTKGTISGTLRLTATATPTSGPPAAVVPMLSPGLLMLLGLALTAAAIFSIRRSG